MKSTSRFITLIFLSGVFQAVFSDVNNCFFGWTQDEDDYPFDDWLFNCEEEKDDNKCQDADCVGEDAACFKVRLEGDESFISVYGCVDSLSNPSTQSSWIPAEYTVEELQLNLLSNSQPDSDDNECHDEDNVESSLVPDPPRGGEDLGTSVHGEWCSCQSTGCNGGVNIRAGLLLSILSLTSLIWTDPVLNIV